MNVNTYVKKQYDNMVHQLDKQGQVTTNFSGQFVTTVGMLNLYRKGYYYPSFEPLQRSIEKLLTCDTSKHKNNMHRSIALMYTEN